MSDPRFKTIKYGSRGRDWDMQIALTEKALSVGGDEPDREIAGARVNPVREQGGTMEHELVRVDAETGGCTCGRWAGEGSFQSHVRREQASGYADLSTIRKDEPTPTVLALCDAVEWMRDRITELNMQSMERFHQRELVDGAEEADAMLRLFHLAQDRLEKAEDALEALAGELARCIEIAPNEDARTAYQWVESYLMRLPATGFIERRAVEQQLTESATDALLAPEKERTDG